MALCVEETISGEADGENTRGRGESCRVTGGGGRASSEEIRFGGVIGDGVEGRIEGRGGVEGGGVEGSWVEDGRAGLERKVGGLLFDADVVAEDTGDFEQLVESTVILKFYNYY
jgi:hypothetical protein